MTKLTRGLYQTLITKALEAELTSIPEALISKTPLHQADVADRVATHIARVVERAIAGTKDKDRIAIALAIARNLIELTANQVEDRDLANEILTDPGSFLNAIRDSLPDGRPQVLQDPLIPLMDTALLTNSPGEPRVGSQVLAEIQSADRIDVVMAFIRRSGIRPLLDELHRHTSSGRSLRVLTTTYTGSTEAEALDQLQKIGAQIRISYDESSTRLHAKAWLFHRDTGCSTAYIGSSNLTHSAQISGLEWNARFSAIRNRPVLEKVATVFNSYWLSGDFVNYDRTQFEELTKQKRERGLKDGDSFSPLEIRLDPFQERLLEQIELSRTRGQHRNLLVSATGTGKTVMAAVDYARLREKIPSSRLLFVVHRKEILTQARSTFRHAVRDSSFGELWVDGERPAHYEHVFASVQSLAANSLKDLSPQHFDVVIVDEFHHAEAPSYRRILEHLDPKELLGLTATPERSDGLDLLHWFDGRIAAELRLWDAINHQRLAPFIYYGVHDNLDYTSIPWKRGSGYDVEGVTKLITANDFWAKQVVEELHRRVDSLTNMRALGFCVSVEHARFMSRIFNERGIKATAIWADTPKDERERALRSLAARDVNIIFSVDLFNEGVDVPTVDTLLMLRPTDSATLFLQQLGRGLRKHENKTHCTVLDFVGLHSKEYRFENRLSAIVNGTRKQLVEQIESGFPFLPAGCHIELDGVSRQRVLDHIKTSIGGNQNSLVKELKKIVATIGDVPLRQFLEHSDVHLHDVYSSNKCWSDLREAAGLSILPAGPSEAALRRACSRMLHVDDTFRISSYLGFLRAGVPQSATLDDENQRRLLRMLVASLTSKALPKDASIDLACEALRQHPQVVSEMCELLELLNDKLEHVPIPLSRNPNVPLFIHARYNRLEIQAAFGDGDRAIPALWQSGVKWMDRENCDAFVVTAVKNEKTFSGTTLYKDRALSPERFQWESQNKTAADSDTGIRYQNHQNLGSSIMLFARENPDDTFYFLGPAHYVKHVGERPMQIDWQLLHSMPGDVYSKLAVT